MTTKLKIHQRIGIGVLLFLLFALFPECIWAQNQIQVTSFQRMETDLTARVTAPKRDQNGEVCALLRIVTTDMNYMFEPDALGIVARENKPGEIWVYVPRGTRRISIMHERYGVLRNYFYPDIIEAATVYEMVLETGNSEEQTSADTNMQLLVMRPEPATADIYIDDEKMPTENGVFSATMKKGEHTYRVEAPMYAPEAGVLRLEEKPLILSIDLKPRFGYMEIFSLPEQGAEVYLDDEFVGQTPYRSDRMPLRDYRVSVKKDIYFPQDTLLSVHAGETTTHTFEMVSTIKPKAPLDVLVMLEGAWQPALFSYGVMAAVAGTHGGYVRARTDFGSVSSDLECDDNGALTNGQGTPYYKEGIKHKARLSITAGYMYRIARPLYLYIGAGYGSVTQAWETIDDEIVKNTDGSATGVAAEIGAIGRFGRFALSLGCQTVGFKATEANLGIGVFF